jgi:hypothetical protein
MPEEGIFLAVDALASGDPAPRHAFPRRGSLRGLLRGIKQGGLKAGDLGKVRLEIQDNKIIAGKTRYSDFEWGFSFFIDVPGIYTFKKQNPIEFFKIQALKIIVESPVQSQSLVQSQSPAQQPYGSLERKYFYAYLPIVFRPWRRKDFITRAGHKRYLSDIMKGESRAAYSALLTAEDRNGIAAFIGLGVRLGVQQDPLLLARDDTPGPEACRFFIEIEA